METSDRPNDNRVSVVYFDGSCPLCSAEIGHYRNRALAKGICFVDVSQPSAPCGAGLDRQSAMTRFHVRTKDGSLVSGGAAFVALWASLYNLTWFERLASGPIGSAVLEASYRASLVIRPLLASAYRHISRFIA
ncbi:MAG: DUF393 domain-containing protein [Proteobacteria bacterium]|nr:DUF393 domain-containing protein [Pseudomonadota bacterium]